jgi:capsular exopolysaccharide synthesis family protein
MTAIQPAGKNPVRRYDASQHGPAPTAPPPEGLMQVLWRRRWTIVLMCALAMASGLVYLWKTPASYRATARVYVQERINDLMGTGNGVVGGTSTPTESYLFLQCELIKSDAVVTKYMVPPTIKDADGKSRIISPGEAKGGLSVEFTTRDGIIFITDDSPSGEESAAVVNAVVRAYVKYQANVSGETVAEIIRDINDQQTKLEESLQKEQKAREDFIALHGLDVVAMQSSSIFQEYQRWSTLLGDAHVKQKEAMDQLNAALAAQAQGDPQKLAQLIQVQQSAGMPVPLDQVGDGLRAQLAQADEQLRQLQAGSVGDNSPAMISAKRRINQINTELSEHFRAQEASYISFLQAQADQADQAYSQISTEFNKAAANAIKLDAAAKAFADLDAKVNSDKKMLDSLGERVKAIKVDQAQDPIMVNVLEYAIAPKSPYSPQPAKTLPAALVAGLILGIGCALMQNWIDQRIVSSDEVRLRLSIPLLGAVPRLSGRRSVIDAALTVHADPHSRFAEAYRAIRTAVFFGTSGSNGKTVLVTSPQPADGKTTSVASLAIATAQAGQRTLLIDADLRNPTQHRVFGSDNRVGLSTLLVGTASIKTAIMPTGIDNLDLLSSGPMPSNPSEMLSGRGFAALLEELAGRYDYIVIDSPPALTVTDAGILGAMADMTILVLRWNKSTQKDAREARDALLGVGARIFGAVINDVPRGMRSYSYYYGSAPEPIAARNTAVRRKALSMPEHVIVGADENGDNGGSIRHSGSGAGSNGAAAAPGAVHVSGPSGSGSNGAGTNGSGTNGSGANGSGGNGSGPHESAPTVAGTLHPTASPHAQSKPPTRNA